MLKTDLHIHSKEDPKDKMKYSVFDVIDKAAKEKFDVIAITYHEKYFDNTKAINYAKEKGILLIPGIEASIKGKEVIIINADKTAENIKTFEELEEYKKENQNCLIIAPHPFYCFSFCLRKKVLKYLSLFDAWEWNSIYLSLINPNKKTNKLAKRYNKPIIANGDIHLLEIMGNTYSLIDADKNIESIVDAIKKNKIEIKTKALSLKQFFKVLFYRDFN